MGLHLKSNNPSPRGGEQYENRRKAGRKQDGSRPTADDSSKFKTTAGRRQHERSTERQQEDSMTTIERQREDSRSRAGRQFVSRLTGGPTAVREQGDRRTTVSTRAGRRQHDKRTTAGKRQQDDSRTSAERQHYVCRPIKGRQQDDSRRRTTGKRSQNDR